jgi:signal transduction histidine kinase
VTNGSGRTDAGDTVTLQRITQLAADLVDARYAALGVIGPNGLLGEFHTVGIDARVHATIGDLPSGKGILGVLIDDAIPLRLHDLHDHPQSYGFPAHHPPMRSFLGVPIRVRGAVFGNLYLTEKRNGEDFTQRDEDVVVALAAAAGVAIENVRLLEEVRRAAADRQRLAILEDRDRIAQDMHDIVIQRLFAVGLGIQALMTKATAKGIGAELTDPMSAFIDDIDLTMNEIRRVIFSLQEPPNRPGGLRADIRTLVTESTQVLGFQPRLTLDDLLDTVVADQVRGDLLAVLREGLTNVAKHAHASAVHVFVMLDDAGRRVTLTIEDDGVGLRVDPTSDERSGHGTINMAARAARLGGASSLQARADGGARLVWYVPLASVALEADEGPRS